MLLSKNMPFDVVNINLKKKPEWFLKNTSGATSVVKYRGKYIMESLVNSDFVDEVKDRKIKESDETDSIIFCSLIHQRPSIPRTPLKRR